MHRTLLAFLALAVGSFVCFSMSGCGEDSDSSTYGDQDLSSEEEEELTYAPTPYDDFYRQIQSDAFAFEMSGGHWLEEFGDAAYYGMAFYIHAGENYDRQEYTDRAIQAKDYDLEVIEQGASDGIYFLDNLEEIIMATLGIIEYVSTTGDASPMSSVDAMVDYVNQTVGGFDDYLELTGIESYALETYGSTAITGVMSLMNLRYAEQLELDAEKKAARLARGLEILAKIDEKAWWEEENVYRFDSTSETLFLYPNLILTLANALAYKLTEEAKYKERAEALFEGVQPLKNDELGCYHSPYSAVHMGAQTDVYSTLSSQNYMIMALTLLWEITGDERYGQEIASVAGFIESYLYDAEQGRILHHWMDARLALPEDPEYFCSGCNLQFLYAMWYLERYLYNR